jgi:hypothetical protein
MKTIGLIILLLGILMILIIGIQTIEHKKIEEQEKVGLAQKENKPFPWSPLAGFVFIGVGGTILILSRKKPVV